MFPTAAVNVSPILKITFNNIAYSYFPISIVTGTSMEHSLLDAFSGKFITNSVVSFQSHANLDLSSVSLLI